MGHSLWTNARLGVVTAEHGCGKSLLIRRLLNDLDERIVVAAVQRENIPAREFLLEILRQFGFALEETDKTDRRRCLERFMSHQASMGRMCLLIVENPQACIRRCSKSCVGSPPRKSTVCASSRCCCSASLRSTWYWNRRAWRSS